MTCPTSAANCASARSGGAYNNNDFAMQFIDADSVAATSNSTSADLAMPAGSEVLFARLVWGARSAAAGATAIKFRTPGQTAYSTLTATTQTRPNIDTSPYQMGITVTDQVKAAGNGTYWVADMVGSTGADTYGGWSLQVAYRNPTLPLRNLTVFEGFADVTTATGNTAVDVPISGFRTPAAGPVNASIGLVSYEGDAALTGDQLLFNGTNLSSPVRPSTNFFTSRISNLGQPVTDRNPNYLNTLGFDAGRVAANGVLSNSQTSTTIRVTTQGDFIYLGSLSSEIDLYAPSFVGVSKSVTNLSGNSPAKVGDTLEYKLSFTNSGQDYADNAVIRDPLPNNVSYVPNTIRIVEGANSSTAPKTDAGGDDQAEYVAGSRSVRARAGTGAGASAGGTLAPNEKTTISFRATVDRAAAGSTITNGGFLDYRARTLARDYTFTTNTVDTAVQNIADLSITKSSDPASQTAGSRVTYTVTAANAGPNAASNPVITDTLPAGVRFASADPPSGVSCSTSGQTVTCRANAIANGGRVAIPITADVLPGTAAGNLVNQASISADTADDNNANNTASAATTITRQADLSLTKTAPDSIVAGSRVRYQLHVTNGGPSTATTAAISDTLPPGLTLIDVTADTSSCDGTDTVHCVLGDIAPGAERNVTITVELAPSFADDQVINSATVTSTTPDGTPADNSASATSSVTRSADVSVSKTASPTTVNAGGTITYTMVASNSGPSDAADVTLTDPVADGLTVLAVTPTRGSCDATGVDCELGTITPGSSVRVVVLARVGADVDPGNMVNTVTVDTSTPQQNEGNDTAAATVAVSSSADLALTKTAEPNPVVLGEDLTYHLSVSNSGPSQARGVQITDELPDGTTFRSASDGCTEAAGTVTCDVGTLDVDDSAEVTILVATPDSAPDDQLRNSASVDADTPDPRPSNNDADYLSSTDALANLSLTKSTSPSPVVPGRDVTYTLTAHNAGPSAAQGVAVTDQLPTGVSYASADAGEGGSCTADNGTVSCDLKNLPSGADRTITVVGHVAPDLNDRTTANTASIEADSPADPSDSDNSARSEVEVAPSSDLGVRLTSGDPDVTAGGEVGYTVTVTNNGPSSARDVVVTTLPEGMEAIPGSGGDRCTLTGRTVICNLPLIDPGSTTELTFRARVLPETPDGPVTGTASIGSRTPDSNPDNNSDTASVRVTSAADLQATKSGPQTLTAGGTATYLLSAANHGPSDATGVTLTDTVPDGLTINSVSPSTGDCRVDGQRITCTADRLAPDGTMVVRVGVSIAPDARGDIQNSMTVGSDTSDPTPDNNVSATTSTIQREADLRLSKTASPDPIVAGASVTYTLTAFNAGPSVAENATITDHLPSQLRLLDTSTPNGISCSTSGQDVSCPLGDVGPGVSRTITVEALVTSSTADGTSISNTAAIASPTPGTDPDTRTATADSTVTTSADLMISKTGTSASPIAGAKTDYILTVVNNGPSVARNVTVTDELPAGASFSDATPDQGRCTAAGGTVSCDLGTVARGGIVAVQVTVVMGAGRAGTVQTNKARVGSDTDDPNSDDNSTALSQPISAQEDLTLIKNLIGDTVTAGDNASYRLQVGNNGPSDARSVQITDTLPQGATFVSAEAEDGGKCTYDPVAGTPEDDAEVRCTWDALDVGTKHTATVTVAVPSDVTVGTDLINTAKATANGPDPTPATARTNDPITGAADLSATKQLLSGAPVAGQQVRWQVTVHNAGPSTARKVTLVDRAPAGMTFTGAQMAQGDCPVTADRISCDLGALSDGGDIVVTIEGRLAEDYAGDELTNVATVGSDTADPEEDNNAGRITNPVNASADLRLTKSASPDTVIAGTKITWTVAATNDGPSTARDVSITDPVPDGVTVDSARTDVGGDCTIDDSVSCTVPTLGSGQAAVLTLVGTVDPGYTGSRLTNAAAVSSAVADPDPTNNRADSDTAVSTAADLAVAKSGPDTVIAGRSASWTVTVRNNGPSVARAVDLSDALPAGLLSPRATFDGGGCSIDGSTVGCPLGALAVGDAVTITVSGQIDPRHDAATITNTASVASTTTDPTQQNDSASVDTAVTRSADLAVTKVADQQTATPGEPVGWTITVTDAGPSSARNAVITDQLPATVTDPAVDDDACAIDGRTLRCSYDELDPGTPTSVRVTGTLASSATGDLANTTTVTSDTPDPNTDDNTDTATSDNSPSADLSIGKRISTGTPVAGSPITFELVARNAGPSDATGVVVTDRLPSQIQDAVAHTAQGDCTIDGDQVNCRIGTLADDQQVIITVDATVSQSFGDSLQNSATIDGDPSDPDSADNSTTVTGDVDEAADVAISASAPDTATAGGPISWTLTARNDGPSTARSVTVSAPIPAGVGSITLDAPDGVSCSGPDGDNPTVTCDLGDLADGDEIVIKINGTVDADYPRPVITGQATIDTASADPNTTNQNAAASTPVVTDADLSVTKASTPQTLTPGRDASYTIAVHNNGPSDASGVAVTDELPAGLSLRGDGPSADSGDCSVTGRTVTCTAATLAAGDTLTVTIPIAVSPAITDGPITNTAGVTAATADSDTENNTVTASSRLAPRAQLELRKNGPDRVVAGTPLSWTLQLDNQGPSDARSVTLTDDLPADIGAVDVTASQGTCTTSDGQVSCDLGSVPTGTAVQITIGTVGTLPADYPTGSITNRATVDSPTQDLSDDEGGDPDASRSASATTDVVADADVSVTKVPVSATAVAGGDVGWTIIVMNAGPSIARNVAVDDPQPDHVDDFALGPPAGIDCTAGGRCTIGTLQPGADHALRFAASGTIPASYDGGRVANNATVDASTPDSDPGDNTAQSEVAIAAFSGLTLDKQATTSSAVPGERIGWDLTVTNNGPSVARGVQLTDPLPAGLSSISTDAPDGIDCSTDATTVSCDVGDLPLGAGSSIVVHVSGRLAADYTGDSLTNTARVTSTTPDGDPSDNTATDTSSVLPQSDLTIAKSGPTDPVAAGSPISWQLTVGNTGPSDARNVKITDPVPAGVTDLRAAAPDGSGVDCTITARTVSCALDTFAAAADPLTITITGQVESDQPAGELINTATISGQTDDPDPTNNSSTTDTTVGRSADLSIIKTVDPDPIRAGGPATFTVTVRNDGPSAAAATTVTDQVADGMSIGSVTSTSGDCSVAGQLISCDLGSVPPTGSDPVIITIPVNVAGDFDPDAFANTATVSSVTPDPDRSNNTATINGDTETQADLKITKTADQATIRPGADIHWTVEVTNDGPATGRNVVITDQLPAGVGQVQARTADGSCSVDGAVSVVCQLGDIAAGSHRTVTITGTVADDTETAALTNAATVSSITDDPNPGNNIDRATTRLDAAADVSVTKTPDQRSVTAGGPMSWTLVAKNAGPAVARNVTVSDVLPAGTTPASAPDGCTVSGQAVTCTIDALALGDSRTFTVAAHTAPSLRGTLSNTATISTTSTDLNADNDAASTDSPVVEVSDLSVQKTISSKDLRVGGTFTYTVDVGNHGASDASGVVVTEDWPAGVQLIDASTTHGSYDPGTARWTVGDLAADGVAKLTLTGRAGADGPITNNVAVTGDGTDPDPTNNTAGVSASVTDPGQPTSPGTPSTSPTTPTASPTPPSSSPTPPSSSPTPPSSTPSTPVDTPSGRPTAGPSGSPTSSTPGPGAPAPSRSATPPPSGGLPNTGGPALWISVLGLIALAVGGLVLYRTRRSR